MSMTSRFDLAGPTRGKGVREVDHPAWPGVMGGSQPRDRYYLAIKGSRVSDLGFHTTSRLAVPKGTPLAPLIARWIQVRRRPPGHTGCRSEGDR